MKRKAKFPLTFASKRAISLLSLVFTMSLHERISLNNVVGIVEDRDYELNVTKSREVQIQENHETGVG